MRTQGSRRFRTGGPPLETALRQALRGEPESLAVIGQQFYGGAPATAEDEQTAGEGICIQFLAAQLCDGVDPLTTVYRLDRNQDAKLRCDLDQDADSHSSRLSVARYEAEAPFNPIRSLPRLPSSSMLHSGSDCPHGATSSTNAAGFGFGVAGECAAIRRFR